MKKYYIYITLPQYGEDVYGIREIPYDIVEQIKKDSINDFSTWLYENHKTDLSEYISWFFENNSEEADSEEQDYDYCYECGGYGDDYSYDENTGEMICNCDTCWNNPNRIDEDD